MRELDRIRLALAHAAARGESALLVTVLGVEGSVYRGAGARMVITSSAETTGAVSGGCLEADIVARAPDVIAAGRAEMARYDTRATDDVVLGLGLGCQGLIDLLLEPLAGDALNDAVRFYERLSTRRQPSTVLTIVRDGNGPALGARVVLDESDEYIEGDRTVMERMSDVAHEVIHPATQLLICGGGNDAIPLARLASLFGWHVTVVDHRSAFVNTARFPDANKLVRASLAQDATGFPADVEVDARTMAVVMAHAATHDRAYLHALLDAGAGYIGVLGPRRRTLELLGGRELSDSVYSPIGLDIGAESPDEIALAIVAEITAVAAGRPGRMLRERDGPIHDHRQGIIAGAGE